MKIIVVAQGKGGVGKTATAAHTAWYAAEAGLRTLAIDLDTGNLSTSLASHESGIPISQLFAQEGWENLAAKRDVDREVFRQDILLDLISADRLLQVNLIYVPLEQARTNFVASLATLGSDHDLCVIDAPPGLSIALASALHAADAVIAPFEMETYSIEGIEHLLGIVLKAREGNSRLSFLGILPSRVDMRNPRQLHNLAQLRAEQGQLLTPFFVGLRTSIAEALAMGQPVWKSRKTAARVAGTEMRQLGRFVLQKLDLVDGQATNRCGVAAGTTKSSVGVKK